MTWPVVVATCTVGRTQFPTRDRGWVSSTTRWMATGWPRARRKSSSALAGSLTCWLGERPRLSVISPRSTALPYLSNLVNHQWSPAQ